MTENNELDRYHDRCDRCGAQAFMRVWIPVTDADTVEEAIGSPTKPLVFCSHHGTKYELEFEARGWRIDDFRHLINAKPSVSANVE